MAGPSPILLIGGTGQVGWELRRTVSPLGTAVSVGRHELDLASPDSITKTIRRHAPSLIINAAAYTAVDRAEEESALAQAINGDAPGVLAEEAKRLKIPLLHYSTDYVFDGTATRPYTETDAVGPANAYGRSKLAGERAIAAVGGAWLVLRTSWIYSMRGGNFLLTVRRLARERDELRIVADQRGAPTWARAVAEATAALLARWAAPAEIDALAERSGIYHLAAAGETSWHGFAEAIVHGLRKAGETVAAKRVMPIGTADYPTPAARPAYSVLDCRKLHETFGIMLPDWRDQLDLCLQR